MNIFEQLVKTAYEVGELDLLLKCDPKYVCDENNNFLYTTDPIKNNMRPDEVDPISFANLVDGIKLYSFSLKSKAEKDLFYGVVSKAIQDMALSDYPVYLYYAVRITQIMYVQQIKDSLPKYYVLNGVLNLVIDTVREAVNKNSEALSNAHVFAGKYNENGLFGYIRDILDQEIEMFNGRRFLET